MKKRKITTFRGSPVTFVKTQQVKDGVACDVYLFDGDKTKDLGIISVSPDTKTPLQKMQKGDKTIEGYMSGAGTFTVTKHDGVTQEYHFPGKTKEIEVAPGDTMQWEASPNSELVFYEICYPPYEDGRFENLA